MIIRRFRPRDLWSTFSAWRSCRGLCCSMGFTCPECSSNLGGTLMLGRASIREGSLSRSSGPLACSIPRSFWRLATAVLRWGKRLRWDIASRCLSPARLLELDHGSQRRYQASLRERVFTSVWDDWWIEAYFQHFIVARISLLDLLICGVFECSPSIAWDHLRDSFHSLELSLDAPEASACEDCLL